VEHDDVPQLRVLRNLLWLARDRQEAGLHRLHKEHVVLLREREERAELGRVGRDRLLAQHGLACAERRRRVVVAVRVRPALGHR
jgi:hypothetical protein